MDVMKSWWLLCSEISSRDLVATLLVTLLVSISLLLRWLLERKKLPPGPFAWPVVGNFPALSGALPHRALRDLACKYGDLMYLRLGSVPTIVVSSVAASKELFRTQDATFLDRPRMLYFDVVTDGNKNMAMSNGHYWRQMRRLCVSELFTPKRVASYRNVRAEEIHSMMKELLGDTSAASSPKTTHIVNLKSWLQGVTSNTMTRMLINKRIRVDPYNNLNSSKYFGPGCEGEQEKAAYGALVAGIVKLNGAFIISDFVPYLHFLTRWQGWQKKLEAHCDFAFDIGQRILDIDGHRQRALNRSLEEKTNYVPNFLEVLLQMPVEEIDGQVLTDKVLILLMLDLMVAGTETGATSVEWAMAELVQQPDVMKKLQAELAAVVGVEHVPVESNLPHLPFLQAVVKETLRLHPPTALNLPRESNTPCTFRGYSFPQHTRLVLNFFAIQRDASVYGKDAEQFRPERFVERSEVSAVSGLDFYELTPFSAGRWMCPAADMGYTMMCMMLAHLLHGFDWALPEGVARVEMTEQYGLTMNIKKALHLVATPKPPTFLY